MVAYFGGTPSPPYSDRMNKRNITLSLVVTVCLLRWLWNAGNDLSPEQAYLALSGYIPAIGVLEGPAGTPFLVAAGVKIFGTSALGATLFWGVLAVATSFALYYLLSPIVGTTAALLGAVLLNLFPVFNAAALAPSSALPLACAGTFFFAFVWRALHQPSVWLWISAGLSAGVGLFFSYAALLLFPALSLVVLSSHRWRRQWKSPGLLLATIPCLIVLVLLLLWNQRNDWVHFIGGTWQTATTLHSSNLLPAFLNAITAVTPVVLVALAIAVWSAASQVSVARKAKFLLLPAALFLTGALYAALQGASSAGTAGLLGAAFSLGLLAWITVLLPERSGRILLSTALLTAAAWTSLFFAKAPRPTAEVNTEVAGLIESLRRQMTENDSTPVFLIAQTPQLASALSLKLPDLSWVKPGHPPVYVVESPYAGSQFALWPRYDQFEEAPTSTRDEQDPFTEQDGANPFVGRNALYITTEGPGDLPQAITAAFVSHELLGSIRSPSGRLLNIYLCRDYETLPL